LLDVSPLHHLALVPAQPFRLGAAAVTTCIALAAAVASVWAFNRRDLTSG
jgi:hypothetical protein